jgi:hypothetical protein
MKDVADQLESAVAVADRLRRIDDEIAAVRPAPGKWSRKEILGHLIDSAMNNHQRIVRLQLQSRLELPGYDQEGWVRVHHYQDRPWKEIIDVWQLYNRNLASLIRHTDPACLRNLWRSPDGNDIDLEFIIRDYLVHMRHHLEQIISS